MSKAETLSAAYEVHLFKTWTELSANMAFYHTALANLLPSVTAPRQDLGPTDLLHLGREICGSLVPQSRKLKEKASEIQAVPLEIN